MGKYGINFKKPRIEIAPPRGLSLSAVTEQLVSRPKNSHKRQMTRDGSLNASLSDPGSRGQDLRKTPRQTWQRPLLFLLGHLPTLGGADQRPSKVSSSELPARKTATEVQAH